MPEQSHAVTVSHPPTAVLRTVNPIMRLLLRTPVAGAAREQFMVVHFTGRKTGRRYAIPLSAHRIDGSLYAITSAPWKLNFRDGAAAEVFVDGKTTAMRVKRAQRMMGLKFRDERIPTVEEFAEAVDRERLAAIRLTPA